MGPTAKAEEAQACPGHGTSDGIEGVVEEGSWPLALWAWLELFALWGAAGRKPTLQVAPEGLAGGSHGCDRGRAGAQSPGASVLTQPSGLSLGEFLSLLPITPKVGFLRPVFLSHRKSFANRKSPKAWPAM